MKLPKGVGREEDRALVARGVIGSTGSLAKRAGAGGLSVSQGQAGIASQAFGVMARTEDEGQAEEARAVLDLVRRETAHTGSSLHLEDVEVAANNGAIEAEVSKPVVLGKVHDVVIVGVDTSWSTAKETSALAEAAIGLSTGVKEEVAKRRVALEKGAGGEYESKKATIRLMGYGGDGVRISSGRSAVDRHHAETRNMYSTLFEGLEECLDHFRVADLGAGIIITIDDMPSDPNYSGYLERVATKLNDLGVVMVTLQTTGGNTSRYGGVNAVSHALKLQLDFFDCHLFVDADHAGDLRDPNNIQGLVTRIVDLVMEAQEEVAEEVRTGTTEEGKSARVRFSAKVKAKFHGGAKASARGSLGEEALRLAGGDKRKALGSGETGGRRLTLSSSTTSPKAFLTTSE